MGWFISTLIYALIMGFTTKIIANNKGYYDDSWFWWGLLFGVFAVIVICAKPENIRYNSSSSNSQSSGFYNYDSSSNYIKESDRIRNRDTLNAGGWECPCGRVNAAYVSTCTCGRNKSDVKSLAYKKEEEKKEAEVKREAEAQKEAEAKKQKQRSRLRIWTKVQEYLLSRNIKSYLTKVLLLRKNLQQRKSSYLVCNMTNREPIVAPCLSIL